MESFEEKLIAAVRLHEIIYNKSKPGYKNSQVKAELWEKIASQLGSSDEMCIKRWRSLRDRFVREHHKLSAPSGSGYFHQNTWCLYQQLTFLKDHFKPRGTQGTHRQKLYTPEEEYNSADLCDVNIPSPSTATSTYMSNSKPFQSTSGKNKIEKSEEDAIDDSFDSSNDENKRPPSSNIKIASSTGKPVTKKRRAESRELTDIFQSAVEAFKLACEPPKEENPISMFMKSMAGKLLNLSSAIQNNAMLKISEFIIKLENFDKGLTAELPSFSN